MNLKKITGRRAPNKDNKTKCGQQRPDSTRHKTSSFKGTAFQTKKRTRLPFHPVLRYWHTYCKTKKARPLRDARFYSFCIAKLASFQYRTNKKCVIYSKFCVFYFVKLSILCKSVNFPSLSKIYFLTFARYFFPFPFSFSFLHPVNSALPGQAPAPARPPKLSARQTQSVFPVVNVETLFDLRNSLPNFRIIGHKVT